MYSSSKKYFLNLTIENSIDLLFHFEEFEKETHEKFDSCIEPIQKLISFVSNNFEFVDKQKMKKLSFDVIEEIIQNSSLKLKDEDSLLEFIISLYEIDESNSGLFEYDQYNNISEKMFIRFSNSIDFSTINSTIWNSIRPRIVLENQPNYLTNDDINRYFIDIKEIDYKKGDNFNGIMHFFANETKQLKSLQIQFKTVVVILKILLIFQIQMFTNQKMMVMQSFVSILKQCLFNYQVTQFYHEIIMRMGTFEKLGY